MDPFEVWEIVDDFAEGIIRSIELEEDEKFGRKWAVTIQDDDEVLVLQFPYDSGYAIALLQKLPNVDLNHKVSFHPYYFDKDRRSRLVLKQQDLDIPTYFTREDPKGYPSLKEGYDDDDVKVWKIEVMKFLVKFLNEHIKPNLPDTEALKKMDAEAELAQGASMPGEDDIPPEKDDDLPF